MKADNIKPLLLKLISYKVQKCCVEIRAQKQVVSGKSATSNVISVTL